MICPSRSNLLLDTPFISTIVPPHSDRFAGRELDPFGYASPHEHRIHDHPINFPIFVPFHITS